MRLLLFLIFAQVTLFANNLYIPALYVGIAEGFEPYQFISSEDNKPDGIDADIIELLINDINSKIIYYQGTINDVFGQFKYGNNLSLITGIEVTESRKSFISFTKPIYYRHSTIFTLESNKKVNNLKDLSGLIIAGDTESVEEKKLLAKDYSEKVRIIKTKTKVESIELLRNGVINAVIMPEKTGLYLAEKFNVKLKVIDKDLNGTPVAIAVKPELDKILEILNSSIDKMQKNGNIDKIIKNWTSHNLE